ncbi:hypothetical protein MNEG_13412 [Monoraphidium neglectum]|uniref:Uncharacterized protein n=1 Tax=Monoraphidium neglectum TaxID=145388 RepID=A0A0D2LSA0_9CHLO|nr:hypothetical protein MNEG_13412 [Monoraphidium neglectum]KIY94549.1 hypothetical protein MNEG_13412 [Monoraphidium neglectum]|eukprot:XP_013893569.1 hypothetical protein MNEG_13412 [Monoraphidium neglectum]
MSGLTPRQLAASWRARLRNAAQWVLLRAMPLALPRKEWAALRADVGLPPEHKGAPGRPATCDPLEPRVRMLSLELEHPRPIPAGQAVVGAISPRPGGPIADAELAAFVGDAAGGLVLVGFGSTTVYGRSLGAADFFELSRAFARLGELRLARHAGGGARAGGGGGGNEDGVTRAAGGGGGGGDGGQGVRVLWGVRDSSLPEGLSLSDLPLGPNTRVVSWYPDNNVLAHPNTLVFVSHFGLHSLYGGAFHGVPMVLSNPSYAAAARGVGRVMRARYAVRPPLQRAADELEIALLAAGIAAEGGGAGAAATCAGAA